MIEEKRNPVDVLKFLQQFWWYESLMRQDEAGSDYAKGVSYGFKLAAAIIETKNQK
ncbi:hypothetical protein SAMN04487970_10597 [Paenibacillus tianmuensis]|uniref:Uncharacterized protein n=1 Tax=Paenibacillus tianmuensis TaxID=624147 RepID=A0A1G4TN72_9BACL|nr:hypothetical protein [Paenibacillus tianmuensis]SCW82794.1 hypothetical protein SAMN04487970_10597 [Paenibacillus tianmuensis]